MLIENKGIKTDLFYLPPFTLNAGEILIINLFNGAHFYKTEMLLKDVLAGNTKNENIIIHQKLTFAEHFTESAFRRIVYPVTVQEYLKKHASPDSPYAAKIFDIDGIHNKTKVNSLTGTPKRLLSLYATLSTTNTIIFDLAGQDPAGAQETYKIVKEEVKKGGAAILLDGYDDLKTDCTKYIELEWI
jgi:hypothetical protein